MRLATSRIFCTPGRIRPARTAMMAITTSSSKSVKALGEEKRNRRLVHNMRHLKIWLVRRGGGKKRGPKASSPSARGRPPLPSPDWWGGYESRLVLFDGSDRAMSIKLL